MIGEINSLCEKIKSDCADIRRSISIIYVSLITGLLISIFALGVQTGKFSCR